MKIKTNVFCVTRQFYYSSSRNMVEIAQGGIEYAGSDCLGVKYNDEGKEFNTLSKAVEAAITIAKDWKRDEPNETIEIGIGCTKGMGLEIDGEEVTGNFDLDKQVFDKLREEAKEFDEKLPKCPRCGEIREKSYGNQNTLVFEDERYPFCSEFCADESYREDQEILLKDAEEEGRQAARHEQEEDCCPYVDESEEGKAWNKGFQAFINDVWKHHVCVKKDHAVRIVQFLVASDVNFEHRPSPPYEDECVILVTKKNAELLQQASRSFVSLTNTN